jgi:hypothetical protein
MRFGAGPALDPKPQISALVKLKLAQCVDVSRQPPAITAVICKYIVFSMAGELVRSS